MIIGGGILVTFLILNSGVGMLCQYKIMLVTGQAAIFAAGHQADSDIQSETQTFVQDLMPTVGLNPSGPVVKVIPTTVHGVAGEQVTVSNQFLMFNTSTRIRLTDTEFASYVVSPDLGR